MFSSGGNPLHRRFFAIAQNDMAIAQNDMGRSRRLTVILSRSEESDRHTIQYVFATGPKPERSTRCDKRFAEMDDPVERRRTILKLHVKWPARLNPPLEAF